MVNDMITWGEIGEREGERYCEEESRVNVPECNYAE